MTLNSCRRSMLMALTFILCFVAQSATARIKTILISCDGFRWDYSEWYATPFLDEMGEKGVSGCLLPSFPSKTFPNHYTLATGLRPEHHGIIANSFLDRESGARFALSDPKTKFDAHYYKGEPLWLTAQHQGLHTAVYYWPGSDVAIQGEYPNVWHAYNERPHLTFQQRLDSIVGALTRADGGPDLIMAYFEEPDASGHNFGPQSPRTRQAVERMDSLLARLWQRVVDAGQADSTNLVVVSDHGMTWFTPSRQIHVAQYLDASWYTAVEGELPANIYAPKRWQQDSIVAALIRVPHLRVWRKADIPAWLHYRDDPNIGDVVVLPDEGWIFTDARCRNGGVHGYDPAYSDMHALFRAWGPAFRHGVDVGTFSNTAVYAIVCRLLGIRPAPNDGQTIADILSKKMLQP